MRKIQYQLVNVFTTEHLFSGNPLAVFPDASAITATEMAALGQQMNLSEITFVTPSDQADAAVRIFTPSYEMPFAGHPTLGTAFVIAQGRPQLTLQMKAGLIPVQVDGHQVTLTANSPSYRDGPELTALASALGICSSHIVEQPLFVNCGTEQLIIQLDRADSVAACQPISEQFMQVAINLEGRAGALVWAYAGETVIARYFWNQNGVSAEDFGTGSACANLGGFLLAQNKPTPFSLIVEQGHRIDRIARLQLDVDTSIKVSGQVHQIGQGEFWI
ncbi:PhzF family phenazine biosynthesis protein [Deefgea sp. CFH1-16]|uniref:PhzF family phenazine biosynthesis protein n=1 Tax=Deefgea sp. CFH1-16 TaxID=2675457 RepID=UPI0015F3FA71|nr:PhzF family phenazine biosynthesis protein [Deefgea sp. CFH1-16]MBM5575008.1 PhzF family phenazine biosynthesis isomerase [Deefgea sp. CFH1-16]